MIDRSKQALTAIFSVFVALMLGVPSWATDLPDVTGAGSLTDNATTQGQQKTNFSKLRNSIAEIPGGIADSELTISSGVITPTAGGAVFRIDTESDAASDDLTTIAITNVRDGGHVELRAENSGRIVTIKNGTGANLIATNTGGDIVLRDGMRVTLEFDAGLGSGQWRVIGMFPGGDSTALSNYRTYLGLGNAATKTTGTSSGNVPLVSDADTLYSAIKRVPGSEAISTVTIASDIITPTKAMHAVETESAASTDNLKEAAVTNIPDGGHLLLVAANTAHDVVIKHNAGSTTNPFLLYDSADATLDNTEKAILFRRSGSNWIEVWRSGFVQTVPSGGTGASSLSGNGALVMNSGGTAVTSVAPSTSGNVLTSNGTTWVSSAPASGSRFTSTAITASNAGGGTQAHGRGATPKKVWAMMKCITNDAGYTAGTDWVDLSNGIGGYGIAYGADSTNVFYRFYNAASPLQIHHKTTGAVATATNANWEIYIYAEL